MAKAQEIKKELESLHDPIQAEILQRFFKTGKGEYGEGDIFLGIKVPIQRKVAKKHWKDTTLKDVSELLNSQIHEFRFTALIILVNKFEKGVHSLREGVYNFYLENTKKVNNWDLVDTTCQKIIGQHILYKLAQSKNLWERRISIISTFTLIRNEEYENALEIAKLLLYDEHDLIQKAVGWMLREIGNRNKETEEQFLLKHYKTMPRTTLRYAIEKFFRDERTFYLGKKADLQ